MTDPTGQFFYEGPRLAPDQTQWAASTWLEGATHNTFNTILPADSVSPTDRPDCQETLDASRQQAWLVDHATQFLTLLFANDADARSSAQAGLGLDTAAAPDTLLGLPARVAWLAPAADRTTVLVPAAPPSTSRAPARH